MSHIRRLFVVVVVCVSGGPSVACHPASSSLDETGFSGNWAIYCGPWTSYMLFCLLLVEMVSMRTQQPTGRVHYNNHSRYSLGHRGYWRLVPVGAEFTAVEGHLNQFILLHIMPSAPTVIQKMCTVYHHWVAVVARCIFRMQGNYDSYGRVYVPNRYWNEDGWLGGVICGVSHVHAGYCWS